MVTVPLIKYNDMIEVVLDCVYTCTAIHEQFDMNLTRVHSTLCNLALTGQPQPCTIQNM